MKHRAVLAAVVAVTFAAVAAGGGATPTAVPRTATAGVALRPIGGSSVRGLAYFEQRRLTLKYKVVVFGLQPSSVHAAHIHGPRGACAPKSANRGVAVPFPDLRADSRGVAYISGRISLRQKPMQVIRRGFYFNVHRYSTPELASKGLAAITCGNIQRAPR
jgi:hypothetical protein